MKSVVGQPSTAMPSLKCAICNATSNRHLGKPRRADHAVYLTNLLEGLGRGLHKGAGAVEDAQQCEMSRSAGSMVSIRIITIPRAPRFSVDPSMSCPAPIRVLDWTIPSPHAGTFQKGAL